MKRGAIAAVVALACAHGCATPQDDPGILEQAGAAGVAGKSGSGGFGGGTSGSGGMAATGGTAASGGTSGASGGASGGLGGTSGSGASAGLSGASGSDGGVPDGGSPTGFGACVTQQQIDSQSTGTTIAFCPNPFAALFACVACLEDAVSPGDITCSPTCVCAPLPPLCGSDAGADADAAASDAALD